MIERQNEIRTEQGAMTTFIVHPERGGPVPIVIFYMDAPGIREELRDMARRLASVGYYVMLPNLYYRQGVMELGPLSRDPDSPERKRMMELMYSVTIGNVMADTTALFSHADTDAAAAKGPAGCIGYCMSGQFAINAAASFPGRISAAASIYGTFLVTDKPDSPHLAVRNARGEVYVGCAEKDHWAPVETINLFRNAVRETKVSVEVELYPGTEHGFAFPQRPAYNKQAAERHWERLIAMYQRRLK